MAAALLAESAHCEEICDTDDCLPNVIVDTEGKEPPPGFRREKPMNVPLVVGGVAVGAGGLVATLSGAANAAEDQSGSGVVLAAGGAALAAGVGLILWGTIGAPEVFVRGRAAFVPHVDQHGAGGSFALQF
jgi:hypothetical protein